APGGAGAAALYGQMQGQGQGSAPGGAGFANGAMQPCWCGFEGCDGTAKRWPCTSKCCKGKEHSCEDMKWVKKSGKVQPYKSCKTKRAGNAVSNAVNNRINNPINDAAKRAKATAHKKAEENVKLSNNIPKYNDAELKHHVITCLAEPSLARALRSATFVYAFTASRDRRNVESTTVFKNSGNTRTSPLQAHTSSSPSSSLRDLLPSEIEGLKLQLFDVFGFDQHATDATNEANMDGFRQTAVARVEGLVHIRLWDHPARAWQKVGGDHAKGRPPKDGVVNVGRRVVRIVLSTEPLPSNFVWNVDRRAKCAQKWGNSV
ncbi:hypothetical protein TeGR_g7380, partial [Tetraparma gracilis]